MTAYDYVIIGAGFAGAATAYHLARRGVGNILLLEQESIPGFHSSGRNAAMMRQCVPDPDLVKLTRDGAAFYAICRATGPNRFSLDKTAPCFWAAARVGTNSRRMPRSVAR